MDLVGKSERMVEAYLDKEKQARCKRVEELFRAHAPRVLAYALRRGVQRADAEDVVAETFLVCYRRISEVPEDSLPWLLGVARRIVGHQFRSERRHVALIEKLFATAADPSVMAGVSTATETGSVLAAFGQLRPCQKEILRLVALEGLTYQQVAEAMGLTYGAIDGRLARARTKLKDLLLETAN